MFFQSDRSPRTAKPPESPALTRLAEEIQALRLPIPTFYNARLCERLSEHESCLAGLTAEMEKIRQEALSAAMRLMSLDAPARIEFNAYTELISGEGRK